MSNRRDKSASADVIYPSSRDDNLGVQRNWFNALFTQLNVIQRTGLAPYAALKGRTKEVFEAVEREFEGLWERHVRGRGLQGTPHRGMLLCCLAIATHKVLLYETGDEALVREVVRTNLGGTAVGVMMRLHKLRLWLLIRLLAEDPYKQAVRFLPSLQGDMGCLVPGEVLEGQVGEVGEVGATWVTHSCTFHSVLAAEGATELLPEFCCQFGMQWLEVFSQYGVRVGLEESLGFGDECCRMTSAWEATDMAEYKRHITRKPPKGKDLREHHKDFTRFQKLRELDWREAFQRGVAEDLRRSRKAGRLEAEAKRQEAWRQYRDALFERARLAEEDANAMPATAAGGICSRVLLAKGRRPNAAAHRSWSESITAAAPGHPPSFHPFTSEWMWRWRTDGDEATASRGGWNPADREATEDRSSSSGLEKHGELASEEEAVWARRLRSRAGEELQQSIHVPYAAILFKKDNAWWRFGCFWGFEDYLYACKTRQQVC
ncbi:hypothetical protein VOLCADRAFT_108158 [Volvox carteri f. nagariensis]|uniref:Uncharacterized protein n=1 Tax=Volvox carteri f. nagariensis TaxID=3068 RepID=D8UIM3_VOLCA|nr:uncharacterized protein VOLCADRAFT_108158 [Volvox carteri f. nagariensis]EFJ40437.1 hypothetical protein VOLCADRAFT_108158 [Volvox carteri f. nagariensis]|eukprot:XP_002958517.1 hypothetical protein VOLCADRAFT_108158 [Volvox carteri f. nagariensis]